MQRSDGKATVASETHFLTRPPLPSYAHHTGRALVRLAGTLQGMMAFALITLAVLVKKLRVAKTVIWPLTLTQIHRSGVRLVPIVAFLAVALGLVIIGQTVSLLTRVGAHSWLGTVMVTVVVRELGPLLTALFVLSRTGMANVIELATARVQGEVEALEVLGIDPVHYLVVPRVLGMSVGVFALTVYLILIALVSGYLWAFIQDVPLLPGDYFLQIAGALEWLDFVILALKSGCFGFLIAIVTCYHGLAQPLRLDELPRAAIRATAHSVIACVLFDALFLMVYVA